MSTVQASQKKAANIAGFSLLIMAVLGPFAYLFVFQRLIVYDNAATTAANIVASDGLFRMAIASLLAVVILDVIVAVSLHIVFKRGYPILSLLAASFRIVYTAMFGVAIYQLYNALRILTDAEYIMGWEPAERYVQAMLNIHSFSNGWNTALIIFGVHLLLLGYMMIISKDLPKYLGILLMIAGIGYVIDSLGLILFATYSFELSVYTFIGELLLIVWLFIRGRKGFSS